VSCCALQLVGRKRAPNFTQEQRPLVYRAWQQYERAKGKGWDRADLAAHLYRQLTTTGGYIGARFEAIYRDEVQDFTQVRQAIWTHHAPYGTCTSRPLVGPSSQSQITAFVELHESGLGLRHTRESTSYVAVTLSGLALTGSAGQQLLALWLSVHFCYDMSAPALQCSPLTRQAELFLDLRVSSDPNGLFYCGDTCQTIARGIGFR
jgi:hypothetical protein